MRIFGVSIQNDSRKEIIEKVEHATEKPSGKFLIATLNNEILLKAKKDEAYRNILNGTDLRMVDSMGIKIVALLKNKKISERFAGADLAERVLKKAIEKNLNVSAIALDGGLSKKEKIEQALSDCKNPIVITRKIEDETDEELERLSETEILFVGLGAPHQEKYIWEIRDKLPKLRVAIGFGGTFDYWTGVKKRAPKIMRKIGLEWLWRLAIQPNRIGRIWSAFPVFLWKALKDNSQSHFFEHKS